LKSEVAYHARKDKDVKIAKKKDSGSIKNQTIADLTALIIGEIA
jgi:hypothetical protein